MLFLDGEMPLVALQERLRALSPNSAVQSATINSSCLLLIALKAESMLAASKGNEPLNRCSMVSIL